MSTDSTSNPAAEGEVPDTRSDREVEHDLKYTRQEYAEYLKGKRIALVGPAPSILNSKQGKALEEYDVIVRLNKAVPVPDELFDDIGRRTDVLYNCMNPSEECGGKIDITELHRRGVKFLVSPFAPYKTYRFGKDIKDFARRNLDHEYGVRFCHIDPKYFARLMVLLKLPNTGIAAILDLLQHDIKSLYITGITFFKGGYIPQYRGYNEKEVMARMARFNLHDQERQLDYMRKILTDNPRVKTDAALAAILKPPKKKPNVTKKTLLAKKLAHGKHVHETPKALPPLPKSMHPSVLKITQKIRDEKKRKEEEEAGEEVRTTTQTDSSRDLPAKSVKKTASVTVPVKAKKPLNTLNGVQTMRGRKTIGKTKLMQGRKKLK